MAYKFTYFTVQHSGTRFLEKYFIHMGYSPKTRTQKCLICDESHSYDKHMPDKNMRGLHEYSWYHFDINVTPRPRSYENLVQYYEKYPIVSTLRHPHKTVISFLSRGYDVRNCVGMWENLIRQSLRRPIVFFDIDCAEEYRKKHLLDIVSRIDCYNDETENLTEEFVNTWKPIGVYNSDIKKEYALAGRLPKVFDWCRFDRAVNWYNKQIKEVRDNISS